MDDERTWLQRLKLHLLNIVNPVLPDLNPVATEEVTNVFKSIGVKFYELELVTVKHLNSKITCSFTSGKTKESCSYCETKCGHTALPVAPVILVGVLKFRTTPPFLVLADKTGEIPCEVTELCGSSLNRAVVPTKWNLIYSDLPKSPTYLELQELIVLRGRILLPVPPSLSYRALPREDVPLMSVSSLKCVLYSRNVDSKRCGLISVCGRAVAVSQILGRSSSSADGPFVLVVLADECSSQSNITVFLKLPSLLHHSVTLKISQLYHFESMDVKLINKILEKYEVLIRFQQKTPEERKVLLSTDSTQITAHTDHTTETPPTHASDSVSPDVQPPSKKLKTSPGTNQKQERESEAWLSDHPTKGCINYQGTISCVICPEGGLYELDGRVRLYLSHYETASLGRGLRCGVKVSLHNVYLFRPSSGPYKHMSGFFCSSISKVEFLNFSAEDSPYLVFYPRNKVVTMLRSCDMMDACWLLDVLMTSRQLDSKTNSRNSFTIAKEIHKQLSIKHVLWDVVRDHILGPCHSCLDMVALSARPCLSSVASFTEEAMAACTRADFEWRRGGEQEGTQGGGSRADLVYVIRMDWMWAVVRASQLSVKKILIGRITNCERTGSLQLQDDTGSFPFILTFNIQLLSADQSANQSSSTGSNPETSHKLCLVSLGTKIVVTDFFVVYEKTVNLTSTTDSSASDNTVVYLHIIDFFVVPESFGSCNQVIPSVESSFLARNYDNGEKPICFRILTKNAAVISALGHLEFTCQAILHANSEQLQSNQVRRSCGGKAENDSTNEKLINIAVHFGGNAFKWFPIVQAGSVYEISLREDCCDEVLPSLSVLKKNMLLTVTEDMVLSLVEEESESCRSCDVGDISRRLFLPPFSTRACSQPTSTSNQRSHWETVSIRGVIICRSYRVDHMSLTSNLPAVSFVSQNSGSSSVSHSRTTNKCKIIALTLQSTISADSIMAYLEFRQGVPLPSGLVPGAVVTLHNLKLKMSRTGNYYCSSFALTSIQVHSLGEVSARSSLEIQDIVQIKIPQVTVSYLGDLIRSLVKGVLPRSMVCVRVGYMLVHRVQLTRRCQACQHVLLDGRCSATCVNKRPTYETSFRVVIEDGSGCAHVYGSGGVVRKCLKLSSSEWQEICSLIDDVGEVIYIRGQSKVLEERSRSENTLTCYTKKAKQLLEEWVTRPQIQRCFKLLCQPFVSQAERDRSIIGTKYDNIKLKGVEFSTLALPRLQLRATAVMEVVETESCVEECKKLLSLLEN